MKIFSAAKGKGLDRGSALAIMGINLLATPGLGTMLAGRFLAGLGQLVLAVAGFCLIMLWLLAMFGAMAGAVNGAPNILWEAGVPIFAAAWFWSLWSSLQILKKASSRVPPVLDQNR